MSMAQNFIDQIISSKNVGNATKPQSFDMHDSTFDNMLQKIMDSNNADSDNNLRILGRMGQPSELIIENFDNSSAIQTTEPVQPVSQEPVEIKEVNTDNNYFSNLLKEYPSEHQSIMNVAKKHAMSAYSAFGKTFVEDLTDFAKDIAAAS